MAEAGIKVRGKEYPIPASLRLGETRTIKRITGLNPDEFMKAVNTIDKTKDPDVFMAMVWWIMHREDPTITVEQLDELEWADIEGDSDEPAVAVDPKAGGELSASSPSSAEASRSSLDVPGDPIHVNGGDPGLAPSVLAT